MREVGDLYGNKECDIWTPNQKWIVSRWACRKNLCYSSSGISLRKWWNYTKYRNPETVVKVVWCFYQYTFGFTKKIDLQCCGMPLYDFSISKETYGAFNEEYCKWCYTDEKFVYTSLEELIFLLDTCQMITGLLSRRTYILRDSYQSLITGNSKRNE